MSVPRELPVDVQRAIARRRENFRQREKLASLEQQNATPSDIFLTALLKDVDEATMSAAFVISTKDIDRSGDLVETAGIQTENHRRNPVVLWDHGRGPIGKLPIGKCEDETGNYTVVVRPNEGVAVARVFFSRDPKHEWAQLVWACVKDKSLRGASMGFRAIDANLMPGANPHDEDPPLHLRETELCELTITAVPDNANALRIAMGKAFGSKRPSREMLEALGMLGGETGEKSMTHAATTANGKPKQGRFNPTFTKALESLDLDGKNRLSKALADITGKAADEYVPLDDEGKAADGMNTQTGADGGFLADNEPELDNKTDTTAAPPADAAVDVPSYEQPLTGPAGQAGATDLHTRLADVQEAIGGWLKRQDHPEFKQILGKLTDDIKQAMDVLATFHEGEYPEADALIDAPVDDETTKAAGDTDSDSDEDGDKLEKSAKLRPAAKRLQLRLKALREGRRPKQTTALAPVALTVSDAEAIEKAAKFMERVATSGSVGDDGKELAVTHAKSLRGIKPAKALEVTLEQTDEVKKQRDEIKALKEKNATLRQERDTAKEIADEAEMKMKRMTRRLQEAKAKGLI